MPRETQPPVSANVAERYAVLLEIARVLTSTRSVDELYRETYRETTRVLEASGFYISRYDPARDLATVVFYADEGAERSASVTYRGSDSEVIRSGRATLVDDQVDQRSVMTLGNEESGITRSAISAPILIQDAVAGVISTQSYRPRAYDAQDLELLQAIADIAAVAIDNAEHVDALRQQRREAEKIEEIGRAITSSLDGSEVMNQVSGAVLDLLAADRATVWLLEETVARTAASVGKLKLPDGLTWTLSPVLYDTLYRERSAVVVDDIRESDLIPADLRLHLQDGCLILTPLVVAGSVTGFLSCGQIKTRAYGGKALNLLKRLGAQASVALENARLHSRLQALSLTDPLTGLPNRRHLQMHLSKEAAAAVRGRNLALVLFDVDGFKRHNDTYGHVEGDRALQTIAATLSHFGRAMNLVARFGGDEFISVLSESSVAGACLYADRVCETVAANPELEGLTLSYGVAIYDADTMSTHEDLIRAADRDLYRAKDHRYAESGT